MQASDGSRRSFSSPRTYVINLARSPERRAHMVAELAKTSLPYEVVEGVDARDLDVSDRSVVGPELAARTSFRPGAAGCALSHLRVYHRMLELGVERAVVLEDDVVLPRDLGALATALAGHMSGAEIVLLNFHCTEPVHLSTQDALDVPNSRVLAYPVHLGDLTSSGAYLITAEACRRMKRASLPLGTYPDDWKYFVDQGALDRVRCVYPMPVTNSPTFRTTIDFFPPGSMQLRLREMVGRVRIPLLHRAITARRRREYDARGWSGEAILVDEPYGSGIERRP